MKFTASRVLVSLLAVALAGCGSLPDSKKIDYKSIGNAKTNSLEVPPDLVTPSTTDRFSLPDSAAGRSSATYSSYSAERGGQPNKVQSGEVLPEPQADKMHIERSGTQRWLVVAGKPEKIWPVVREFWQEMGFIINLEQPDVGVMETDWAENRAKIPMEGLRGLIGKALDSLYSTAERDKFRTRIEAGGETGTTDIFISHRGMYEVYVTEGKDQTRWQPRPVDPDLEAEMLRRLMVRLGSDEKKATEAIASSASMPQADRAKVVRQPDGASRLELQEGYDRAWRRVGLALDRVGFTVEDRDRSKGMYFVRYVDPEIDVNSKQEEGWLSKLAFWKGKADPRSKEQYRVYLKAGGDVSIVQVLTKDNQIDKSETARKILSLLQEQLK